MDDKSIRSGINEAIQELYEVSDRMAGKHEKSEVNYSKSTGKDKCETCSHFEVERKDGCTEVVGLIEPEYWCTRWEGN
jgi:hypothetical protein